MKNRKKRSDWRNSVSVEKAYREKRKAKKLAENGGEIVKTKVCPHCGAKTEVYSRITGYYRPVQNWNDGKAQEYKNRTVYDILHSGAPAEKPVEAVKEERPVMGGKHPTRTMVTMTKDDVKIQHPDSVKYVSTIEEDLSRRDFTVNAMAYHPSRGLIDPYGGQVDLKRKIIRCVGNPDRRFNEDALRMLRAYRFCAKLGFSMDETVKTSIDTNASLIQYVSIERIVHELKEIMETNPQVLASMTLLLKPVFNELDLALRCSQNSIYHYTDVLHHTLDAMCYLKPYDETLAFALLFHDLGKVQVKTTDSNGKDHFKHHAKVGSELSKELCRRFKLYK